MAFPPPGGILALDLATVLGWAYGLPTGCAPATPLEIAAGHNFPPPECGSFRCGSTDCEDPEFFGTYHVWLQNMLDTLKPFLVGFEAPIVGMYMAKDGEGRPKINIKTVKRLMGLAANTEAICYINGLGDECWEEHLMTIKKHATGNGRADKKMMMDAGRARGWQFVDDNACDAMWLWDKLDAEYTNRLENEARAS